MSNKQKTAVDGLWDYLKGWIPQGQYAGVREVYLEAKEMEKEQHWGTWINGVANAENEKLFQDHWNETYGGNK